jgi:hypothetical protein
MLSGDCADIALRRLSSWHFEDENSLFPRAALQPKSPAGQEKGEEVSGNTVEPFGEPSGDFRCNSKGRRPDHIAPHA